MGMVGVLDRADQAMIAASDWLASKI
jgi:hypothetical protein